MNQTDIENKITELETNLQVLNGEIKNLLFKNYILELSVTGIKRLFYELAKKNVIDKDVLINSCRTVMLDEVMRCIKIYKSRIKRLQELKGPNIIILSEKAKLNEEKRKLKILKNPSAFKKYFKKSKGICSISEEVSKEKREQIITELQLDSAYAQEI